MMLARISARDGPHLSAQSASNSHPPDLLLSLFQAIKEISPKLDSLSIDQVSNQIAKVKLLALQAQGRQMPSLHKVDSLVMRFSTHNDRLASLNGFTLDIILKACPLITDLTLIYYKDDSGYITWIDPCFAQRLACPDCCLRRLTVDIFNLEDDPIDLSLLPCLEYLDLGRCTINQQDMEASALLPNLKTLKVGMVVLTKKIEKRGGLETLVLARPIYPQMQTIETITNLLSDGVRVVAGR